MASGFITLPNGKDWSCRWTGYDLVLETIKNNLANKDEEGILKKWIKYILPNEENGDVESGYCFYKKIGEDNFESILRIIDTRLMKDKYQIIFWNKVADINNQLSKESTIGFLINQLHEDYINSLNDKPVEPTDMGLKEIFLLNEFDIAKDNK